VVNKFIFEGGAFRPGISSELRYVFDTAELHPGRETTGSMLSIGDISEGSSRVSFTDPDFNRPQRFLRAPRSDPFASGIS
jgi:hypothetical protein